MPVEYQGHNKTIENKNRKSQRLTTATHKKYDGQLKIRAWNGQPQLMFVEAGRFDEFKRKIKIKKA